LHRPRNGKKREQSAGEKDQVGLQKSALKSAGKKRIELKLKVGGTVVESKGDSKKVINRIPLGKGLMN